MAWVSEEIKRILREKDARIIDGVEAMRRLLGELKKQIIVELTHIPEGEWGSYHLKKVLTSIEYHLRNWEDGAKRLSGDLLDDAWGMGAEFVDQMLSKAGIYHGFGHLPESVLEVMKDFTVDRITGLSGDALNKVKAEITLGALGQKTPYEVMKSIEGSIDSPSIFGSIEHRAEVITKTEMGRVFSRASFERMKQASKSVPGLMKQWRHAGHPKRPRPSHLAADGETVPVEKPFNIGGVRMMYPRDPGAPLEEVINCGCDVVPWHPDWE